jgi:hypothetical protein
MKHTAKGQAHDVVMNLLRDGELLNQGHHLGIDNFYTSMPLADELITHKTTVTGTLRRNRVGIPEELTSRKYKPGEMDFMRSDNILTLAWREKKSQKKALLLLSTHSAAEIIEKERRNKKVVTMPKQVDEYNQAMGGVDLADQKIYFYALGKKSKNWWKKVAHNMMSRTLLNAYIIYWIHTTERPPISRKKFLRSVVNDLVGDFRATRKLGRPATPLVNPNEGVHVLQKLNSELRRQCAVCSSPNTRKRTRYFCPHPSCDVGLHPGECDASYHRKKLRKIQQ